MAFGTLRSSACLFALAVFAAPASAGQQVALHLEGDGVFDPANIGTPDGGEYAVIGDGSGLAAYAAAGGSKHDKDRRILSNLDGVPLAFDEHVGAVQSYTMGTFGPGGTVEYPAEVGENPQRPGEFVHVTRTPHGEIRFTYPGKFVLGPAGVTGLADFKVVGGTGLFDGATGEVAVVVTSPGPSPDGTAAFHYEFDGVVELAGRPGRLGK